MRRETGDMAAVRALLAKGADVNEAQGDGMTALHWAAYRGDATLAAALLKAKAALDATTRTRQSHAIARGQSERAR